MIERFPLHIRRWAFWIYAAVLAFATHWPRLRIDVPGIERPDLFLHLGAFAGWYLAFYAAAYIRPLHAPRTLGLAWVVTAAYATVNEGSQLLPFMHRHAAWDDLGANIGGATLGLVLASVMALGAGFPHTRRSRR
jgi:hypothetical protein